MCYVSRCLVKQPTDNVQDVAEKRDPRCFDTAVRALGNREVMWPAQNVSIRKSRIFSHGDLSETWSNAQGLWENVLAKQKLRKMGHFLSLRFNGHFPGEPGLAGIQAKDDGGGGDNWTLEL